MAHAWTICREVDLARDFVGVERIAALATTSAKAAHELHIAVKSGGVSIGTDGASVALNLILPDGISTMADGSIESGECIATLPPLCYQRGETRGVLLLQFGTQAAIPVYAFVLRCFEDLTDVFADPDHVIPSLAELLAQLAAAKAAAKAAQDGASAANAAAGSANAAAEDAAEAEEDAAAAAKGADDAASAANAAAQTANAAAARLDGLTATATGLDAGSAPTLDVSTGEDGAKRLAFGIPKGDKGDTGATPNLAITVKTGEPGTEASTVQGGTPENPTLEITIPRGNTGDIGALTINGKTPDAGGAVTLTAADVGALPTGGTAADSSKLGGKVPEYYIQPRNLLDNSYFWNPVEQAGKVLGGLSIAHGSNTIARKHCGALVPASEAKPGYAMFRWREDGEPERYEKDGMDDFYHIGLKGRNGKVLNAKSTAAGFVESPDSGWKYAAPLLAVDYGEEVNDMAQETVIYSAVICTKNDPLTLRDSPNGTKIGKLPKGCTVDVLAERDGWMQVRYGNLLGWASGDYISKTSFKEEEVAGVTIQLVIVDEAGREFRPIGAFTVDVEIVPDSVD